MEKVLVIFNVSYATCGICPTTLKKESYATLSLRPVARMYRGICHTPSTRSKCYTRDPRDVAYATLMVCPDSGEPIREAYATLS